MAKFYTEPMALRIKHLREAKGWTQAHLAEKAKMSRSQLAMIEAETRPANTLRLNAIAAALGVRPDMLFGDPSDDTVLIRLISDLEPADRETLIRLAESLAAKNATTQ